MKLAILLGLAYLAMGVSTYTGVLLAWAQGKEIIDKHLRIALLAILAWPYVTYSVVIGIREDSKLTRRDESDNMGQD